MSSDFGKTVGFALQDPNFTKTLIHRRLFSSNYSFKTANFWSMFRKEYLVKPANSAVAVRTV